MPQIDPLVLPVRRRVPSIEPQVPPVRRRVLPKRWQVPPTPEEAAAEGAAGTLGARGGCGRTGGRYLWRAGGVRPIVPQVPLARRRVPPEWRQVPAAPGWGAARRAGGSCGGREPAVGWAGTHSGMQVTRIRKCSRLLEAHCRRAPDFSDSAFGPRQRELAQRRSLSPGSRPHPDRPAFMPSRWIEPPDLRGAGAASDGPPDSKLAASDGATARRCCGRSSDRRGGGYGPPSGAPHRGTQRVPSHTVPSRHSLPGQWRASERSCPGHGIAPAGGRPSGQVSSGGRSPVSAGGLADRAGSIGADGVCEMLVSTGDRLHDMRVKAAARTRRQRMAERDGAGGHAATDGQELETDASAWRTG